MDDLLSLAGLTGLIALFLLAWQDGLSRRREQGRQRLDALPFDAGIKPSDQLNELSEVYATGQGLDRIGHRAAH